MKNRTVLLYMTFVFLSNFSTILYFLTVYLEFDGLSMVAISSMMIAYQVSKFILELWLLPLPQLLPPSPLLLL